MPLYVYQCAECGHIEELLQKLSDEPLKVCPKCKEEKMEKIIGKTSFILNGSGWHSTDYKK